MIVILKPDTDKTSNEFKRFVNHLENLPDIAVRMHEEIGQQQRLTEFYLVGDTISIDPEDIHNFPVVERVFRVSREYRVLGRHNDDVRENYFDYNGVRFGQDEFHLFAGLCAVDTKQHAEIMMRSVSELGLNCTRMGAYKPRTNPYSFQGYGKDCLPYVFELAGKYGIKVIAMEITHDVHIQEIDDALENAGNPTGVMLQIGTRNTQNFELLKSVGRQRRFPVLIKRGFGITLEESLNAAEYLASEGNHNVVFCLRGMKTNMGDPHRNLVDFSHVPVVRRLTHMPVCVDPSHSVGSRERGPEGILDVMHVAAQGVLAGANMVLADFHPAPEKALVDGPQALEMNELAWLIEDLTIARNTFLERVKLAEKYDSN